MREKGMMENNDTKVTVSLGYTLNLGNFQSLRIDIGIEDSLRNGEHAEEAFNRVYGFVENKLIEKVKEAQASSE
jgi:methyl coenzyme M reductase subunit D